MARSIWNGVITFGMVSIPVKLYAATESHDIAFHQLHDVCDTRIKYQKFCPHCDRVVNTDEIERGYEYARGQYVVMDDNDFEQLPLPSKHAVEVSAFVDRAQIDPVYYEKSYYIEPDEAALRPFTLFFNSLEEMGMVAIATITLRNKERLCALRVSGGTLVLDTLLYPDEVRIGATTHAPEVKVSEKELKMAERLIDLMKQDFDPSQYHDHYREALKKVIEAKLEGKEVEPLATPKAKVVDLMEALRASVESIESQGKPSLKAASAHESEAIKGARERTGRPKTRAVSEETVDDEPGAPHKPTTTGEGPAGRAKRKTRKSA